jgi:hypothetical protein
MSPALSRGLKKAARTILQLAAGGALTALVNSVVGGLSPSLQGTVMAAWTAVVAFAQNALETAGAIPTLLPTSPPPAAGGVVVGQLLGSTGEVVGEVTSKTGDLLGGHGAVVGPIFDEMGDKLGEVTGPTGEADPAA